MSSVHSLSRGFSVLPANVHRTPVYTLMNSPPGIRKSVIESISDDRSADRATPTGPVRRTVRNSDPRPGAPPARHRSGHTRHPAAAASRGCELVREGIDIDDAAACFASSRQSPPVMESSRRRRRTRTTPTWTTRRRGFRHRRSTGEERTAPHGPTAYRSGIPGVAGVSPRGPDVAIREYVDSRCRHSANAFSRHHDTGSPHTVRHFRRRYRRQRPYPRPDHGDVVGPPTCVTVGDTCSAGSDGGQRRIPMDTAAATTHRPAAPNQAMV